MEPNINRKKASNKCTNENEVDINRVLRQHDWKYSIRNMNESRIGPKINWMLPVTIDFGSKIVPIFHIYFWSASVRHIEWIGCTWQHIISLLFYIQLKIFSSVKWNEISIKIYYLANVVCKQRKYADKFIKISIILNKSVMVITEILSCSVFRAIFWKVKRKRREKDFRSKIQLYVSWNVLCLKPNEMHRI